LPEPIRTFRAPDSLWQRAREIAGRRNESLSDVIRAALERYVKRHS
jgi:predicted transcriptional regulator